MRAGGDRPKQYQLLAGRMLIEHTLERLAAHPLIAGLMVTLGADDAYWPGIEHVLGKPVHVTQGGAERYDSVLAGLLALPSTVADEDFVLVHDAARPCVRAADIERLIVMASQGDGGLLGAPLRDTLKRANVHGHSQLTEPREQRWRAFTPQMFRRAQLQSALYSAAQLKLPVSDEAMAMEQAGFAPLLVEGAEDNLKVTTAADFAMAEFLLGRA